MRKGKRIDYTKTIPLYRDSVKVGYSEETSESSEREHVISLSQEITALKREVAQLREYIDTNTRDIQTFAETASSAESIAKKATHDSHNNRLDIEEIFENSRKPVPWAMQSDIIDINKQISELNYKAGQALTTSAQFADKLEMLIDDMVTLDERTQELKSDGLAELGGEIVRVVIRHIERGVR